MTVDGDGRLTIDLDAIIDNHKALANRSLPARTAAVVKADAYGTGVTHVAPLLARAGVQTFFVAQAQEGAQLRAVLSSAAPAAEIYIFSGVRDQTVETFRKDNLVPVLNSLTQVDLWAGMGRASQTLPGALHVDTGINRLGLEDSEVNELILNPSRLDGIELTLIMSHLACADTPDHPLNRKQLKRFKDYCDRLPAAPASLANSAGILLGTEYHFDLTRPGIGLYGGNPCPSLPSPIKPVVTVEAPILQNRLVNPGESVGYGASITVERPTRIAVVSAGYADGLPRALSNIGHFYIAGKRVNMIGRMSMDLIAVDVTDIPTDNLNAHSTIEIIGVNSTLETLAEEAGTISYELLTGLGRRFARHYLGEEDKLGG
jgi:alanine racemase